MFYQFQIGGHSFSTSIISLCQAFLIPLAFLLGIFFYNMGSLVLTIALQPVNVVILTLILRISFTLKIWCLRLVSKARTFLKIMRDNLLWNGIIGTIDDYYMMLIMCALINIKAYNSDWSKEMIKIMLLHYWPS